MSQAQNSERGSRNDHPALGDEKESSAINHVGERPGGQNYEEDWQRRGRLYQPNHQRRYSELRHEPTRANILHPRTGIGDYGGDP